MVDVRMGVSEVREPKVTRVPPLRRLDGEMSSGLPTWSLLPPMYHSHP